MPAMVNIGHGLMGVLITHGAMAMDDPDSDSDDPSFLLTPSGSQKQHAAHQLTPAAVDRKNVLKDYRSRYCKIIKRAGRIFSQEFGMELVEIDPKNHAYILINKLEPAQDDSMNWGDATAKMGLLLVILSIIFMKGNAVKDSLLWHTLKKLRIDPSERHQDFGDVKKLITEEFVKQKYLDYSRIPHTDPAENEFQWGPRAARETSKMEVLEFVAKMHSEQDPKTCATQFKEAQLEAASSQPS
ncbi:non-structural maintenance of chromosomes element 3 homolog [Hemitrygon akajei]|uniref:non-structural maintenance of chromosomes element 3 homolog n=1 Tax=Hemitrygon akajei TaxID=2704970 RepID=UPI003BF98A0F